jgi:pyruvate formate lyase activating enzyme
MILGGLQKNSLIDYPGKLSCVLFLSGCNFTCPYCHNPQLLKGGASNTGSLDEKTFHEFLQSHKGFIDGVVISGGEPTIHEELVALCKRIKVMGYPIKLDTNGSRPNAIKLLIDEGLVDYVAMDIKTDPLRYPPAIAKDYDPSHTLASIETIMGSGIPYEFRTTCIKPIVDGQSIKNIARTIRGSKLYALQRFRDDNKVLSPAFFAKTGVGHSKDELRKLKVIAEPWVKKCIVRF